MGPLAVVKHFDVFGHGHPCPGSGGEHLVVIHFVFHAGKKRLGNGIIPGHTGASHRLDDAGFGAVGRECRRGVLGRFNRWLQHCCFVLIVAGRRKLLPGF